MGYPRSQLIDPTVSGTYHCVSRCVRRAFLCGDDALSGRNFDHRKQWVEDRLLFLAEVFSASVLAYAVMSNHLHVVVHMAPEVTANWSDDEVAERWVRLCPVMVGGEIEPELCRRKVAALAGNQERVAELRHRLGSLSWLMRCLNERGKAGVVGWALAHRFHTQTIWCAWMAGRGPPYDIPPSVGWTLVHCGRN